MNAAYKQRLSAINNLVLVMFEEDTMVQPKESEVRDLFLSICLSVVCLLSVCLSVYLELGMFESRNLIGR